MASYTKRGNSYRIKSFCGYTPEGKQVVKSKTWTPPAGMTDKQIEKELTRQMVLFDEECSGAAQTDGHVKFQTFADQWMEEHVTPNLGKRTQENYRALAPRIYDGLGHLYLDKITPRQIQRFINTLSQPGANRTHPERGLSAVSIKNHRAFISSVFSYAVRMGVLKYNPCAAVTLPATDTGKEKQCYTLEEAQAFLDALAAAPIEWQAFFSLAMFGGFRREELLGFEFQDFDHDRHTVTVQRVSLYTKTEGIFTADPKTKKSRRTLKLPAWIFDLIRRLRTDKGRQRLALGDQWHECGRLFTKLDGSPLDPGRPYKWLKRFCEDQDLPFYGVHQFRHLNASLLIYNGEDVRTVSASLGHSQTSTTLNIYTHAFETAQARASEAIADKLPVKFGRKQA